MHEAALAQAALPAPTSILGLPLKAYSLGHELFLIREGNPLAVANRGTKPNLDQGDLEQAVLICCHTFEECRRLHSEWLLALKLWVWELRIRRLARAVENRQSPIANRQALIGLLGGFYLQGQFEGFRLYQDLGRLEFPLSELPDSSGAKPGRPPGAPFLLRMQQFLTMRLGLSQAAAWDFPYGLAVMQWECWQETEGGLRVANFHDAEHAAFVARMEAEAAAREKTEDGRPKTEDGNPKAEVRSLPPKPQWPQIVTPPDVETRPAGFEGPLGVQVDEGDAVQWVWTADASKGVRWVSGYVLHRKNIQQPTSNIQHPMENSGGEHA